VKRPGSLEIHLARKCPASTKAEGQTFAFQYANGQFRISLGLMKEKI